MLLYDYAQASPPGSPAPTATPSQATLTPLVLLPQRTQELSHHSTLARVPAAAMGTDILLISLSLLPAVVVRVV